MSAPPPIPPRPPSPAVHAASNTSPAHSSHGLPPPAINVTSPSSASVNSPSSSSTTPIPSPPPTQEQLLHDLASHISLLSSLLLSTSTSAHSRIELLLRLIDYAKQSSEQSIDLVSLLSDRASSLFRALRLLSVDKDPNCRAQTLRTLRYVLGSQASVALFYHFNLDLFLIRALERESKYLWERLQAFKLYKKLFALAPHSLSRAVVQSILAIAEQPKDDFRRVSLDALREMMLLIPRLVCSCNGMRVLIDSILDPACSDIASSLTLTLLFLLDQPSTRHFLRPSLDLIRLLSVFTDTSAPDSPDREARRLAAHRCVVMMMRSWPGILCLTHDSSALTSLVQVLALPVTVKGASWAREAVFDLLLEILSVCKASDLSAIPGQHNLLHSYVTIILLSFIDCGLIDTLTALSASMDGEFRGVATKLLTEVLALAAHLLPSSLCSRLNSLPNVMQQASAFSDNEGGRIRALTLISTLSDPQEPEDGQAYQGAQHGIYLHRYMQVTDFTDPPVRHSALLSSLRQHFDQSFDDKELESTIKRTQIPQTKDFRLWDTQLILQLLEGPLMQSANLVLVMQKTKFIKRLCSFLRPDKLMFSSLDYTAPHMIYVRIAVTLMRVLLSSSEGREYQYFIQLIDGIFQLILSEIDRSPSSSAAGGGLTPTPLVHRAQSWQGKPKNAYRCLSRPNLPRKLSQCYMGLIGQLSSSRYGMGFFDKFGLYEFLYAMMNDPAKDYLTRQLILRLDYSERTARTLLETWVKGGSVGLRKFAVSFIRSMIRKAPNDSHWCVGMLVAQLTHGDAGLRASVLSLLEEVAMDAAYLSLVVKKKPQMGGCGQLGHCLMSIMVSSKAGLEYVQAMGVLGVLMKEWGREGCVRYVESVERSLVSALSGEEGKERERESVSGNGRMARKPPPREEKTEEKRGNSLQVDKGLASTNVQTSALAVAATTSSNAAPLINSVNTTRSASPTPSSPPPSSPSPHSPAASPSSPFFFFAPTPRTPVDDYFFSRVHDLPWIVELTAEWPNGRVVLLPTDCFVFSSPYELPQKEEEDEASSSSLHPLRTYLACNLLDSHGVPLPYRVDGNVTLRARVSLGGGQSGRIEHENVSRPSSAASSTLNTPTSQSRGLGSPFRTPSSSPRGPHSPHPSMNSLLPAMSEHDTHIDDREWMKSLFSFPSLDHVCKPAMRTRASLDLSPSIAVSAGGGSAVTNRGSLWTQTKDEDRCRWSFALHPAILPPAPRRERASSAVDGEHFDWLLDGLMFPIALPSDGVGNVCLARHLYGELSQTSEGCDMLRQSGHVAELVRCVMEGEQDRYTEITHSSTKHSDTLKGTINSLPSPSTPSSPSPQPTQTSRSPTRPSSHLQKRAALWALGHISSTSLGLSLLLEHDVIVPFVSYAAVHHPVLSFRGTCFYILSVMAKCAAGRALLGGMGWSFASNPLIATVVPSEGLIGLREFLSVKPVKFVGAWPSEQRNVYGIPSKAKGSAGSPSSSAPKAASVVGARVYSDAELDVLLHISNLCNYVTQKNSLQSLRSMRSSSAFSSLFTSPQLLLDTMRMLACYLFRLPARRFLLFDLFGGVTFTEQNMAVFDEAFWLGEVKDGEAEGGDAAQPSGAEERRPLLLSPPSAAHRPIPTPTPRRTRPTLNTTALPPHPHSTKAAHSSTSNNLPPANKQPAASGSARRPLSPPQPSEGHGAADVKVKSGMSAGRDRSLSVPARGSEDSYGARGGAVGGERAALGGAADDSVELSGGVSSASGNSDSPTSSRSASLRARGAADGGARGGGGAEPAAGREREQPMAGSLSRSPVLRS